MESKRESELEWISIIHCCGCTTDIEEKQRQYHLIPKKKEEENAALWPRKEGGGNMGKTPSITKLFSRNIHVVKIYQDQDSTCLRKY